MMQKNIFLIILIFYTTLICVTSCKPQKNIIKNEVKTEVDSTVKNDIIVETLPGATAFVPALVNSGLPATRFTFEGFLPQKKGRQTALKQLAEEERTMIFYESPFRLVKSLADFMQYFGEDRLCCVSRELTKKFEENKRGTLKKVHDYFSIKGVKGEIVIVVAGKDE